MAIMPQQKNSFPWWKTETADFWLQHIRPHWSFSRAFALVVARRPVAADAVAIELKPNRHVQMCQPGQHMSVIIEVSGVRHKRYYSPTVLANGNLQITVKQVVGGKVSTWIHRALIPGKTVELGKPHGEFHQLDQTKPIMLLAAGSGITPMYSLLSYWLKTAPDQPIELHYWASRREQLCFREALAEWEQTHECFSVTSYLTQEPELLAGELSGRFDIHRFLAHGKDLSNYQVVVCGPFGFVQSCAALEPLVAVWHSETHQEPQANNASGTRTVTLVKSGRVVEVPANKTLLEGLEQAQVAVPFGCRRGICNTCSCQRLEGTSAHLVSGNLSNGDGVIQLCMNQATTDIHLDL